MSRREDVALARGSSDLGEAIEGYSAIDVVRAIGAVAQKNPLPFLIWRLVDQQDKKALRPAFDGLLAVALKLGLDTNPIHTVSAVLTYLVDSRCPDCQGRGYEVTPGTPHLSEKKCPTCEGTGIKPPEWGDHEHRLNDWIQEQQAQAAGAISRKLRDT